jgi:WD40 repeat protein
MSYQIGAQWQAGDVILDLYRVIGILGQDGLGEVYRVRHLNWNIDLAVKSPKSELVAALGVDRFEQEAEAWVNLGLHPHVVACYYVRRVDNNPLVFTEYVNGGTLQTWIADRRLYADGITLALRRILDTAIQFAWGLHYAHEQGLIHQDVKPETVMMSSDGIVKVTDFGLINAQAIATVLDAPPPTSSTTTLIAPNTGALTPAYCSPEQVNKAILTRRSDLWGWGLCVLEMFAGDRIWISGAQAAQVLEQYLVSTPNPQLPQMPDAVAQLLRQCFQVNPDARPHTLQDVALQLQQIYQQLMGEAYPRREPEIVGETAESLNNRAVALWDLGKYDDSLNLWNQALTMNPRHAETLYNRGLILWRSPMVGQRPLPTMDQDHSASSPVDQSPSGQAQSDLELLHQLQASRSQPDDWNVNYLISLVHLERGDFQTALRMLEILQNSGIQQEDIEQALSFAKERIAHIKRRIPEEAFPAYPHLDVLSVDLSRDGRFALSGGLDKTVKLWDIHTGRCLCTFKGHKEAVSAVAFSPNGSYILSASQDKTIKLCEVVTTSYIQTYKGHGRAVQCLAFSPDGQYFLSGSDDRTLRLWDVLRSRCIRVFRGHRGRVTAVAYSRDGRFALSTSDDKTIRQWDIESGWGIRTFELPDAPATAIAYSPDGRYALSAGQSLLLWDIASESLIRRFEGHQQPVRSVIFSADGQYALSASDDATIRLWEVATGRCLRTFVGHEHPVRALAISADGYDVIAGDASGLKRWAVNLTTLPVVAPLRLSRIRVSEAFLSSDLVYRQELLQARTAQGQADPVSAARHIRMARSIPGYNRALEAIEAWTSLYTVLPRQGLNAWWESASLDRHIDAIQAVELSPDRRFALSASKDWTVKLWDLPTSRCLRSFEGHRDQVNAVAFSPDGAYALSGSTDKTLKLWGVSTGSCVSTFRGHSDAVNAVALSPDGNYAISGGADRTLRLWDTTTGRCLRTVEAHRDQLMAVAFTADGTQVISGSQDATLKLWDLASGSCVLTFEGHQAGVRTLALSRDRRFALSGGDDRTLKLWDLNSGECLRTLEGHQATIHSVALSADGHYALSGGDDRILKLWDLNSGECLRTLEGHQATIHSVALSADGRYALSGGDDRILKLWILDWELVEKFPTAWDEGAKAYLTVFLALHTPTLGLLPKNRDPNDQEVRMALTRQGTPTWTEADFMSLLQTLGEVGYGWLRPEGVRQELQTLASTLQQAPPAAAATPATAFATAFGSTFETAFPTGFVEPEPPVAKVILSVTEGSLQGQRYEFSDRTTCIIGRAKDCNLQLPNDEFHKTVSRYHCLLDINPPAIRIRDLGSLHGTYVNGQIIGRRQPNQSPEQPQASFPAHDLAEGDEIKLGKTIFRIQIEPAPADAPNDTPNDATSMVAPLTAFDQTVAEPFPAVSAAMKPKETNQRRATTPELQDYAILKPIHQGAKEVYLARHHRTNEVVALKIMPLQPETRLPAIEACLQQIESTKTLQHIHIARLIEAGSAQNLLYILQEYCDRGSVVDLMQERGGHLSVDEAVAITLQVLDALEYAHSVLLTNVHPTSDAFLQGRGLVHRDLQPSQILLTQVQGALVAKIADYGLAKAMDQTGLGNFTADQRRADAPLFMPRQRAVNFKYTEPEVDIWASAACLYYMLTGAYPRDLSGKDPYLAVLQTEPVPIRQRNPDLPKALAEAIDMALIDTPEIQIKDAAAFKQVLNNVR